MRLSAFYELRLVPLFLWFFGFFNLRHDPELGVLFFGEGGREFGQGYIDMDGPGRKKKKRSEREVGDWLTRLITSSLVTSTTQSVKPMCLNFFSFIFREGFTERND